MYGLNYGYRTSLSPLMIKHMKNKYLRINNFFNNKKKYNILDIGSNDGTFLNFFSKKKNITLFAIDPSAKKFRKNYNKKINLIINYFKRDLIVKKYNQKKKI